MKKLVSILVVLVMIFCSACSSDNGGKNGTDTPAPTETPKATEAVTATVAPTDTPAVTEAPTNTPDVTEVPTDTPAVTEAPVVVPEAYDENGKMYVEYTLDYYLAHARYGVESMYDLEEYAKIVPYVGYWYTPDEEYLSWQTGYYVTSDAYVSLVYGDGSISPIAVDGYLNNAGELVIEGYDDVLTAGAGCLTGKDGTEYPKAEVEFPNTNLAPEFCAVWKYSGNEKPDYSITIFYGNTYTIVDGDEITEGTISVLSPETIALLDAEGNTVEILSMTPWGTIETEDGEDFYYYLDVVDEREYGSEYGMHYDEGMSDEELEVFFENNAFYAVDSEFEADSMRELAPVVGYWALQNESEYVIDESFAYKGIMVYSDGVWTWVNAFGIPSANPNTVSRIDSASVVLHDDTENKDISFSFNDSSELEGSDGSIYKKVNDNVEVDYPKRGVSTDVLGIWCCEDGLGTFLIDRDGMATFFDEGMGMGSVETTDAEHILVSCSLGTYSLSTYEANSGILYDDDGNVYQRTK